MCDDFFSMIFLALWILNTFLPSHPCLVWDPLYAIYNPQRTKANLALPVQGAPRSPF